MSGKRLADSASHVLGFELFTQLLPVPGAEAVTAGIYIYAYITRKDKVKYFLQAHLIYFLTNSYRKMSVQSLTFIIKIFLLLHVR